MGDINVLRQLIDSMSDAVIKLEQAQRENKITDFEKIKSFILDIQKRIKIELAK